MERLLRRDHRDLHCSRSARSRTTDLRGLVYALTPRQKDGGLPWYKRPATLGALVLGLTLALNVIFW